MLDIVCVILCSLLGFSLGLFVERSVKSRCAFWADMDKYISRFAVNVDGRQLELPGYNGEFAGECGALFAEYLRTGKLKGRFLREEKLLVDRFFSGLNAVSSEDLKRHLAYYSVIIGEKNKQAAAQASKASIYVKLGILFGVMAGIILI